MSTLKRIFISDIHMGDGRSISPGGKFNPYGWFHDNRPAMLANFLKEYCIDDESVQKVVIVGDLFDEWVCPAQFDPTDVDHQKEQFENIANAPQNQPVTSWLKELASQRRLIYLRGNHDMLANKPIMTKLFPGIEHPGRDDGNDDDGHDVYHTEDGIWAEHGHWYGLFNAPYAPRSGDGFSGSVLPLGFFISRINAQEVLKTGDEINRFDMVMDWIGHIHSAIPDSRDPAKAAGGETRSAIDEVLIGLFRTMVNDYASDQHGALMNGLGGVPGLVTWQHVEDRYRRIFSEWSAEHPNNVGPFDAMWSDAGNLDAAARSLFFNNEKIKIVICGHTHKHDYSSTLGPLQSTALTAPGTERIYANAGAWTNDKSRCTFIETEFYPDTGNHIVRLKEWTRQYVAVSLQREEGIRGDVWVHSTM